MPFTPGDPNINRNGRPKGSPNVIAQEIKEAFALTLQNKLPELEELLSRVAEQSPEKAVDLLIKLSNRFLPELSRTEVTGKDGEDLFKNVKFDFGTPQEDQTPGPDFDINEI